MRMKKDDDDDAGDDDEEGGGADDDDDNAGDCERIPLRILWKAWHRLLVAVKDKHWQEPPCPNFSLGFWFWFWWGSASFGERTRSWRWCRTVQSFKAYFCLLRDGVPYRLGPSCGSQVKTRQTDEAKLILGGWIWFFGGKSITAEQLSLFSSPWPNISLCSPHRSNSTKQFRQQTNICNILLNLNQTNI